MAKPHKALGESTFKPPAKDGVEQAAVPMLCVGDLMQSAIRGRRLLQLGPGKCVQFCEAIALDGPKAVLEALVKQAGNKANLNGDDKTTVEKAAEKVKAAFSKPKPSKKGSGKGQPADSPAEGEGEDSARKAA